MEVKGLRLYKRGSRTLFCREISLLSMMQSVATNSSSKAVAAAVLLVAAVISASTARVRGVSRSLQDGATQQFKTALFFDGSIERLTEHQQILVKDVLVHGATEWLSNVLKVRPLTENVTFERPCEDKGYYYVRDGQRFCRGDCQPSVKCGPVEIPVSHLRGCRSCSHDGLSCETGEGGEGVSVNEGQFVLYVSAIQEQKCSSRRGVFVDSAHCLQEGDYDRPSAAYLNFCPLALSTDSAHTAIQLQLVIKELIHSLAFSDKLFPFYHNEQGYPRTSRDFEGKPVLHLDGSYSIDPNTMREIRKAPWTTISGDVYHVVSMIVTPNVLRETRDHFNCPTMRGAELEDQGGVGVAFNHWEQRIFGEELMTASPSSQPVVSRITLALLEDSGWYLPDYRYASVLSWGHGAGCAFVNDSCSGWMNWAEEQKIPSNPFCDGLDYRKGRVGCVDGRTAVGPCFARNYTTDLPLEYQYLSRKRGGSLFLYDYCPVYNMVTYGSYRIGQSCLNPDHAPSSNLSVSLEVYGSGSRCFDQSEPFVRTDEDGVEVKAEMYGAGCYQYHCSAQRVFIKVGNKSLRCRMKGQKKNVVIREGGVTYTGKLICPGYDEVCAAYDCLNQCSDHGTCSEGVCYCQPGYYGDDCSQSHAQFLLSCDDVECLHGAMCNDSGGYGFVCACPDGYTGAFCEREVYEDPCIGVTCSGHGHCTPSRGGKVPRCNCHRGWTGGSCQRVVDFCEEAGTPCGNHGECVVNSTSCACQPSWTGKQCELAVDLCQPESPCKNGGTCISHFDNQTFSCKCKGQYEGDLCERMYFDPCTHEPCQNNANCSRVNSSDFYCDCPGGWMGTLCNQEDRCLELPCENGGTCLNVDLSFVCVCARGYTGDKCRHLEDPCLDNPCQHGGTCRPVMNAPRGTIECDCLPDFYGEFCDLIRIRPIG